jgi:hypothetical protein
LQSARGRQRGVEVLGFEEFERGDALVAVEHEGGIERLERAALGVGAAARSGTRPALIAATSA